MSAELDILAFHRALIEIPSVSHDEAAAADFVQAVLEEAGVAVERIENNVLAWAGDGDGPTLLLNSHLDTVPATDKWTRDPWAAQVEDGKVYGLGSNDAGASVAAMTAAFLAHHAGGGRGRLGLMLVADEETGGRGTEIVVPELERRGVALDGVVVGEPTALDVAVAQKGMMVLELAAQGDVCHSANARALGAKNANVALAEDLLAVAALDLGDTTLQPTLLRAGEAKNALPAEATCILDVRTAPEDSHADLQAVIAAAVSGELRVRSDRLVPRRCPTDDPVVRAALAARPDSKAYASSTMSDLVWFDAPAIKCGPGRTERSHTPDEFVLESEILEGATFYADLATRFLEGEGHHGATVGQG